MEKKKDESPLISPEESERFPGLKSLKSQAISKGESKSGHGDTSIKDMGMKIGYRTGKVAENPIFEKVKIPELEKSEEKKIKTKKQRKGKT